MRFFEQLLLALLVYPAMEGHSGYPAAQDHPPQPFSAAIVAAADCVQLGVGYFSLCAVERANPFFAELRRRKSSDNDHPQRAFFRGERADSGRSVKPLEFR